MNRKIPFIYISILIIGAVLIVLSFLQTPTIPMDTSSTIETPVKINEISPDTREFTFDTSHIDMLKKDFVFFTNHQYVKVYADDLLVYENSKDGGIWGHTTGSVWNFVTIPHKTVTVRVILTAAYDNVAGYIPVFHAGDKLTIYREIFVQSLPALSIGFLIIIIGLSLIIYWLFLSHTTHIKKSLLYLGTFALLFGLWSLNETNAAMLIIPHRSACAFMAYVLLIMLSSSCVLFIKEFLVHSDKIIWKVLCLANCLEFFLVLLLQFLNIADMKETLFLTHIMIFISLFYLLGTLVYQLIKKQYSRELKAYIIAILILTVSTIADVSAYYGGRSEADSDVLGRIGFILFILILAREAASNSLELIEKGRKAKIYEELAITDMLTGIRNRNAYIMDVNNITDYNDIMIITFDLNNLKQCNDTKGHTEGDNYILSAIRIIEKIFSKYGTCYRIGGDEFCVIVKNAATCPIEQLLIDMNKLVDKFNASGTYDFEMHIACGYALFDESADKDLEDTRDRADMMMYENKSYIKSKN